MPANTEIFKQFLNHTFIETGSHVGNGIQQALDAGFQQVYSIELVPASYQKCVSRFQGNSKVHLFHGSSIQRLPGILKNMQERCTIWLDSHDFCIDNPQSMIIEELLIIGMHFRKNHTILIDDMRLWETQFKVKRQTVKNMLKLINPVYKIDTIDGEGSGMKNDILYARP